MRREPRPVALAWAARRERGGQGGRAPLRPWRWQGGWREIGAGMQGYDPVANSQVSRDEISRCETDPEARLKMSTSNLPLPTARTKGPRYVPVARRGDKPDAIAWLVKHHPELSDAQIGKLIGTTKDTITKIRERTHWNISNIQPKHPAMLGLCKQPDLNAAIEKAGGQPKQDAEQVANLSEVP